MKQQRFSKPFICDLCKAPVQSPFDQFEERLEYRRADGSSRPHVITLRRLCRKHMEEAAAFHKRPNTSVGVQEGLL